MSLQRRKKFGLILSCLLLASLLLSSVVLAADTANQFASESEVSPYRIWTVTCNRSIDAANLAANITISPATNIAPSIQLSADRKSVQIYPPATGYTAGQSFVIKVGTGLKDSSGVSLGKAATKTFIVSTTNPYSAATYTKSSLDSTGLTCTWTAASNTCTLSSNDYNGVFVANQAAARVNGSDFTLTGIPSKDASGIIIPAKMLWESFGIVVDNNNLIKESMLVTQASNDAYTRNTNKNVLIKTNDRILAEANTTIYSGSSQMTMKMNDSSQLTLEPNTSIIINSNQRNTNGSKTVLVELKGGTLAISAVKPAIEDSLKIKVGTKELLITDTATLRVSL
ncbi:MAG: hypothetical protein APF81_16925 [Desulfosporosinus sp. BRH_c37]|nr:MAG: hypothetical protein APF81_16925 [Desulfosporosinus sp. BRH_c37]